MHSPIHRQRGVSLVEALIGSLLLSIGLMGALRLQSTMRLGADVARERIQALQMAQQQMEAWRSFSGSTAFQAIGEPIHVNTVGPSRFSISPSVVDDEVATLKAAAVAVHWPDRSGSTQTVALHSQIGGASPIYSAVLSLPPQGKPIALAKGIPPGASRLNSQQSAFKPVKNGSTALMFNTNSGQVTAWCKDVDAAKSTRALTAADLASCESIHGLLLSGFIRFAASPNADAQQTQDVPLPLQVRLTLESGASRVPACESEALKTVRYQLNGQAHTETVPLAAEARSVGVSRWTDLGERFVAYHCVVALAEHQSAWSGRLALEPQGWSMGHSAGSYKACPYQSSSSAETAAPRDQSTKASEPATDDATRSFSYADVRTSLSQQNYLVIPGPQPCPEPLPSSP